jgi:uncharacterized protein HemX
MTKKRIFILLTAILLITLNLFIVFYLYNQHNTFLKKINSTLNQHHQQLQNLNASIETEKNKINELSLNSTNSLHQFQKLTRTAKDLQNNHINFTENIFFIKEIQLLFLQLPNCPEKKEIEKLIEEKSENTQSINHIFEEIDNIKNKLTDLPFRHPQTNFKPSTPPHTDSKFSQILIEIMKNFASLITIKHTETLTDPWITLDSEKRILLDLQLNLDNAISGLLNHHQKIYQKSLINVVDSLDKYIKSTEDINKLKEKIQELSKMEIEKYIDIETLLFLLEKCELHSPRT